MYIYIYIRQENHMAKRSIYNKKKKRKKERRIYREKDFKLK